MAHDIGDRPTQDVDLFTDDQATVPVAAAEAEEVLHAAGYKTGRQDKAGVLADIRDGAGEDMAEWLVTSRDG
jgi:hypothetical protein